MSYQVLARKWRPQIFADVIGQEHVLRALINALEQQRLHHAYLFTGTRGVGKTTLARILARCLNCEKGVSATPCGECSICQEISEGRFVDLIEVDAASRTKVEDTRDLLDNVQYAPTRGRYKIYLIDEVHMLSTHSFNALLKTLEEPPEHVKFLLATTDPQKLPVTVLSRCLQFNLKNLSAAQIVEHLQHVLTEEKVTFEEPALWLLAAAAAGSMRDALSLTDQAIAHGDGNLKESEVASMLGTVDQTHIHQLMDALIRADGSALLQQCQELAELAVDYFSLVDQLLALIHRIAVAQTVPAVTSGHRTDDHQVAQYAEQVQPEDIQLYYQMLILGRRDLSLTPDMQTGFEMLMLRLHAFHPEVQEVEEAQVKKPSAPSDGAARSDDKSRVQEPEAEAGSSPLQAPEVNVVQTAQLSEPSKKTEGAISEPAKNKQPPMTSSDETGAHWIELYGSLNLDGMLGAVCGHLSLEQRNGDEWLFGVDREGAGALNDKHRQKLQEELSKHLGKSIQLRIDPDINSHETPAQQAARIHQEKLDQAQQKLLSLPQVQSIMAEFDGTLMTESIKLHDEEHE